MTKLLDSKVALVTGASRGIGRCISLALAAEGARVILTGRDKQKLQDATRAVEKHQPGACWMELELSEEESIKTLVAEIKQRFGRLDILINNAGITFSSFLQETHTCDWDRLMAVNARGPFILCREALDLLRQSKQGTIVNISSVVGVKGYPLQSAYTASKHALRGMSISLAEELKNDGIRVHVICPGGVDTEMVSRVRPDINKDELIDPEDIAELVLYLVTHKGNAVVDEIRVRRATASPWF